MKSVARIITLPFVRNVLQVFGEQLCSSNEAISNIATLGGSVSGISWPLICVEKLNNLAPIIQSYTLEYAICTCMIPQIFKISSSLKSSLFILKYLYKKLATIILSDWYLSVPFLLSQCDSSFNSFSHNAGLLCF